MGFTESGQSRANQGIPRFACNPDLNHARPSLNSHGASVSSSLAQRVPRDGQEEAQVVPIQHRHPYASARPLPSCLARSPTRISARSLPRNDPTADGWVECMLRPCSRHPALPSQSRGNLALPPLARSRRRRLKDHRRMSYGPPRKCCCRIVSVGRFRHLLSMQLRLP